MRIEKAKLRAKLREDKGLPPVLHKVAFENLLNNKVNIFSVMIF